jgi:hypothetical protein
MYILGEFNSENSKLYSLHLTAESQICPLHQIISTRRKPDSPLNLQRKVFDCLVKRDVLIEKNSSHSCLSCHCYLIMAVKSKPSCLVWSPVQACLSLQSFLCLLFLDRIVHDGASSKNKCTNCNSIMWFIFNLERKNKPSEIALIYTYTYTGTTHNGCRLLILITQEPTWAAEVLYRRCRNECPSTLVPCL